MVLMENEVEGMSFLKWVGGKAQLLPKIADLLPDMKMIKGYAEPFIGGGAVFFYLKRHGYLEEKPVYLSDVNEDLINSYKTIRSNWKEVVPILEKLEKEHTEDFYYKLRDNFPGNMEGIERAAQFIYLNKACFNGTMRVNSDGKYNMGSGQKEKYNNRIFDINELNNCSKMLQGTNIGVMSYEHVMRIPDMDNYFVYCDPPYDNVGHVGYTSDRFIEKRAHLLGTFKKLDELGCKVMMSNNSTPEIMNEFEDYNIIVVKVKRLVCSVGENRGDVDEVIITNYKPPKKQRALWDF